MTADQDNGAPRGTRLFSAYLKAADDLHTDAVMLCEVIGDEIQSISLRVAAESMKRMEAAE